MCAKFGLDFFFFFFTYHTEDIGNNVAGVIFGGARITRVAKENDDGDFPNSRSKRWSCFQVRTEIDIEDTAPQQLLAWDDLLDEKKTHIIEHIID